MAFGFPKSRSRQPARPVAQDSVRRRPGVPVTAAQVAAARLIIERAQTSNKPVDDAVVAIANAEQVPGTSQFQVLRYDRSGRSGAGGSPTVAPARGAAGT